MYKKCLFLLCAAFITQTKSDGCHEDFFKCFSEFADAFFQNITRIEHVNASENIPEGFKQVKDFEIKSIQELTDSIKDELSKLPKPTNNAIVVTDNPKTQIYVKTYFGDFFEHSFEPEFGGINIESYDNNDELIDKQIAEDLEKSVSTTEDSFTTTPKTTIKINEDETHALTTQTPSIIDKQEQKSTKKSLLITKSTQKVDEKDLKSHNNSTKNNTYSNINNNRIPKGNSTPNIRDMFWKNQFEKDIRENIIQTDDEMDYEEDTTDYPQIDYIDLYKDTTNEENVYVPTDSPVSASIDIKDGIVENVEEYSLDIETPDNDTSINLGNASNISDIFPWIATIFIKNGSANSQFQYTCDGALLNEKLLLTAARCVMVDDSVVDPADVLVFLGKKSLQNIGEDEKIIRISHVKIHSNFSNEGGRVTNDLALLMMEESVEYTDSIQPAALGGSGAVDMSATTAWDLSGGLTPVFFENTNEQCNGQVDDNNTICATFGYDVPLCPSRGGLYVTRRDSQWYLHGIHSGLPEPVCFSNEVHYTPLADQLKILSLMDI